MKLRYHDKEQTQPFVRIVVCLVYQAINQIVQTYIGQYTLASIQAIR